MNDFEQEQLAEQLSGLHELLEVLLEGCTCCATPTKKSKKEK
tara:strand:- start:57 stop:182 length:126 start_codon:yes stop_codon:yes gene_type:complete